MHFGTQRNSRGTLLPRQRDCQQDARENAATPRYRLEVAGRSGQFVRVDIWRTLNGLMWCVSNCRNADELVEETSWFGSQ